jgi:TetR/AcrR family transcriptional repressor of bet genes
MPKIVDHAERRNQLAWAACRAIVAKGIEQVTMRDVAAEIGRSTGMVTHYFEDKEALLVAALSAVTEGCHRRIVFRAMEEPITIRELFSESLPLDAQRRLEWGVWLNYWAAIPTNANLASQQRQHYESWHHILESALTKLAREQTLRPDVDIPADTDFLMAVVDGVGLRATIDPAGWPPSRQLKQLDRALATVLAEAPAGVGIPSDP